ncbi:MAG: hypothetical protein Q9160_000834 [Pyrenula sp. 1 TL-2023]
MGWVRSFWLRWKSLKLPWRRTFLVGQDLAGNTFWEFKDALNANRFRRIVRYSPLAHHGDIKISPQWHQWLRHTRYEAPSLEEQEADVIRQTNMKQLAQLADERWASKPSFLDKPRPQPAPITKPRDPGGYVGQTEPDDKEGVRSAVDTPAEGSAKPAKENPWAKNAAGPSEKWQPESWTPGASRR